MIGGLTEATEVIEATEDGRDGKSCDSLSDPPDVLLRLRNGRAFHGGVPCSAAGEPARRTEGTESAEGLCGIVGEPIWRGDGTVSMIIAPPISAQNDGFDILDVEKLKMYA